MKWDKLTPSVLPMCCTYRALLLLLLLLAVHLVQALHLALVSDKTKTKIKTKARPGALPACWKTAQCCCCFMPWFGPACAESSL